MDAPSFPRRKIHLDFHTPPFAAKKGLKCLIRIAPREDTER